MYIFVDKNTEICPFRDSQLRVTLYVAARFHISRRFEVIADYFFKFGTKNRHCVFEPPLRDLGATYAVHIRLIGNPVVDFLLIIIKLFSRSVTALQANID